MIDILLGINFLMLAVVVIAYVYVTTKERRHLRSEANQAWTLQQRVYQAQVLKEINDRIGYSLDTDKIVEIITSSLGNLLDYDTVAFLAVHDDNSAVFKCHVQNSVNHDFVEEVREKILASYSALFDQPVKPVKFDDSITGNILDDSLKTGVISYFNLPLVISDKFIGIINVSSRQAGQYGEQQASILYSITNQAAAAVSQLQAVLESEKGKLSAIIYSMADGVINVDLQNQLLVSNPAVQKILEINTDAVLTMFDIVDALAGKLDLRTKIEQALVEDKPIFIQDVTLKDKALEVMISPVKNRLGEKIGAAVVFHDITTEKSLEKVQQEFTAMMVHELRAPLTAVRWSSESLLKSLAAAQGVPPEKVKDTMMTIETASNNMLELVNDLLDTAKIESGKFELNIQDYDLVEVINEQVKAFTPQAEQKHLTLVAAAPEKFRCKFDRVRIAQVLGNLLSNAIKYSDAGQIIINLAVNQSDKRVIVSIKDTGIGIAREDLPVLFSKFRQLNTGDHARKGTGLGLVVCKGIVEAHGGKIWAESAGENLGSTFAFSLPVEI